MLESITIKGFQVHQNISIELDPNLTVITGRNNSGKSAIIRALKWCLLNKRPKDDFTTWDKKKTSVKLIIDGHSILRKKAPKLNLYSLDGKKFQAVNKDVPKEIQKLLNIEAVNFQFQHDQVFWFSLSAPQLSKELNSIVNLSVIDSSLSNITSEVRKATTIVEVTSDRLKNAKEERKKLKWVKEADRALAAIEQKQRLIDSNASRAISLADLLSNVSDVRDRIKNDARLILRCQNLTIPLSDATECERKSKTIQKKIDSLKELLINIKSARREKCEVIKHIDQKTKEMARLQRSLRVCPLCNQKMMKP